MSTSEQRPDEQLDPATAKRVDAEARPRARAEFAARLREQFVAGSIKELPVGPPRAERPHIGSPRSSSPFARFAWLAAAAAMIVIGVFLQKAGAPRAVFESLANAASDARVDGAALEVGELREGSRVETGEHALDLRVAGAVVIEIGAHSKVRFERIASSPGGDFAFAIESGALRVVTGPDFAPSHLVVRAPDADVSIVGTEFGVDVIDGQGTCVCCTRGEVDVRATHRSNELARIAADQRSFCSVEPAAPPALGAPVDAHVAPVVALRRFW